ncbi:serine beta-lactamase-like protein LACTB [Ekhidna lutea]|uniref:Serine beta-lactamase-like protein LACTB n=1 Tax=Ekhidna lutea TaxID=447679 RepID=A0A239LKK7_EKHLU|nr:serine hydrolase domain-containing protein [Ekhidna lutea]SNT31197.1 serine beta-lactamase-like protein LACTB [Ekhidna lutea]
MKRFSCLLSLLGLGWLLYCLFQPIVDWNFGWKDLPENRNNTMFKGVEDEKYLQPIHSSKLHLDSILTISNAPSISVAAMINGKMVWTYAIGFKDLDVMLPADTATRYRVGSVSKALTSLGLGKMIESNQIYLNSSIQYYTNFFQEKPKITIRQLASHQSGIRNYGTCFCFPVWEYYRNKEFESVEESLSDFESDGLLFNPGEGFSYSSFNYTALSHAMEKASNMDFLSLMEDGVFKPLGMIHTMPDKHDVPIPNKAVPYDVDGNLFKKTVDVNLSNKWAGGGFLSAPSDLVRAGNALLDSGYLNSETIELLTSPQRLKSDSINEQYYALGWRHNYSERYFNGERKVAVIHHGGMAVGGLALLAVYPEFDLVIAITINKTGQEGRFELFDYITPIVNAFIKRLEEKSL